MRRIPKIGGSRAASATRGRLFLSLIGLVGVLVALALLYVGYNSPKSIPGRSYYTLQGEFDNADSLTASYQIRVGGKLVGQVLNPRVRDGKGVVDLQLSPTVKPLLSDTKLRVRPRSPVGVRFVEMVPGTKGKPLPDQGVIPSTQTSASVQIDEALSTLDADRRVKARQLINELGAGFFGRGEDLNEAIGRAPQFFDDLGGTAAAIVDRKDAAARLVTSSNAAANAADPVRQDIASGFDPQARALRPFAEERKSLGAALDEAPRALRSITRDLARTEPLLRETTRLARTGTPALAAAPGTFGPTAALLGETEPGFKALRGTLKRAANAVDPTLKLLRTARPVLPDLEQTLRDSGPILDELAPRECDIDQFMTFWAESLAFGDGFSNVLRFNVESSLETFTGAGRDDPIGGAVRGVYGKGYPAPCEVLSQKITQDTAPIGGSR